jgi:hypothetical protein
MSRGGAGRGPTLRMGSCGWPMRRSPRRARVQGLAQDPVPERAAVHGADRFLCEIKTTANRRRDRSGAFPRMKGIGVGARCPDFPRKGRRVRHLVGSPIADARPPTDPVLRAGGPPTAQRPRPRERASDRYDGSSCPVPRWRSRPSKGRGGPHTLAGLVMTTGDPASWTSPSTTWTRSSAIPSGVRAAATASDPDPHCGLRAPGAPRVVPQLDRCSCCAAYS